MQVINRFCIIQTLEDDIFMILVLSLWVEYYPACLLPTSG